MRESERERAYARTPVQAGEGQREGDTDPKQDPGSELSAQSPMQGSNSTNHEIMT